MKKIVLLSLIFLCSLTDALANHIGTISIDFKNASTIAIFLNQARFEERLKAGFNDPALNTDLVTNQTIDAMNYDALIQACLLKIDDTSIKYMDGKIMCYPDRPAEVIALQGFLAACFFTLSYVSIQNNGLGSLAAKAALFSIGAGFAITAAKKLFEKVKNNTPTVIFDQHGFTYKESNQIHTIKWSEIKEIHLYREVAITKPEDYHASKSELSHIEYIRAYLIDKSDNVLCSYCPFQAERFAELVSYYVGQALSLPADSLPITVEAREIQV